MLQTGEQRLGLSRASHVKPYVKAINFLEDCKNFKSPLDAGWTNSTYGRDEIFINITHIVDVLLHPSLAYQNFF